MDPEPECSTFEPIQGKGGMMSMGRNDQPRSAMSVKAWHGPSVPIADSWERQKVKAPTNMLTVYLKKISTTEPVSTGTYRPYILAYQALFN